MTDPGNKPLTAVEATAEVLDAQEARHPMALVVGVSGSPELVGARVVVRQAKGGAKSLVGSFQKYEPWGCDAAWAGIGINPYTVTHPVFNDTLRTNVWRSEQHFSLILVFVD